MAESPSSSLTTSSVTSTSVASSAPSPSTPAVSPGSSSSSSSPTTSTPTSTPPAGAGLTPSILPIPTPSSTGNSTAPNPLLPVTPSLSTSTDAPSPSSTSAAKQGANGLSGGSAAGLAIGCLVAGAVVALIIGFFLYRRQSRKRSAPYHHSDIPYDTEAKSNAAIFANPAPSGSNKMQSFLPQPVEDAAITKELSKIRDNIKNHVQSYYHLQPVQRRTPDAELTALSTATGFESGIIADMLANTSTRADAMRLFIAWALLSRCEGGRQPALLPSEIAPMVESMSQRGGTGSANTALFSRWKVLTGALLAAQYGPNAQGPTANVRDTANVIEGVDLVLGPFVQVIEDGGRRHRNLEMIVSRAAKLGFLLFSQPGSFRFDFAGSRQDNIVVFPGLVQVTGDDGQVLSPPKVFGSGKEFAIG